MGGVVMDKHIKQSFQFRYIKIGNIVNTGVVHIGSVGNIKPPPFPKPKAQIGPPTTTPQQFAPSVPLQSGGAGASGGGGGRA